MNTLRIAIRAEGQMVNAYVAMTDEDVLIASFHRALCEDCPELHERFKVLMTNAGTMLIESVGGKKVLAVFEQDAPEHEKAGSA